MQIGCSKSTISREMSRNGGKEKYSIVNAQNRYQQKRKKCRKPRILSEESLRRLVIKYIVIILLLGVNFKSSKKTKFFHPSTKPLSCYNRNKYIGHGRKLLWHTRSTLSAMDRPISTVTTRSKAGVIRL